MDMLAQLSNAFTNIPFNKTIGLTLEILDLQQIRMRFEMKEALIGNFVNGILHGGVISSVLDMAGGMIVMANIVEKNRERSLEEIGAVLAKCATVDLQVSFLSPGKGQYFLASAELIKAGRHLSFARMALYNQDDILIATANGTYTVR